jgi:hypothetical protein
MICTSSSIHDQAEEDETGAACSINGGKVEHV